jgi:hypothetical protein
MHTHTHKAMRECHVYIDERENIWSRLVEGGGALTPTLRCARKHKLSSDADAAAREDLQCQFAYRIVFQFMHI